MGLFFDRTAPQAELQTVIEEALRTDPGEVADPKTTAEQKASEIAPAGYGRFNKGRFVGALLLFAAIVVAAIITDAADIDDSSKALWGLAATVFGVVVGFLGGEKTATS